MQRIIVFLFCSLAVWLPLKAQEFSAGFRAGLNFSSIGTSSELGPQGEELEYYEYGNSFHVGAMAGIRFTDYFGVRAELLYSQRGGVYNYDGPSYWVFRPIDGSGPFLANANRRTILEITNSYIDLPLMAVLRLDRFEFNAGVSVGLLVTSRSVGELRLTNGQSPRGTAIDPFTVALDFNYLNQDKVLSSDNAPAGTRSIDNQTVEIPSALNSYFDEQLPGDNQLFQRLDAGLLFGISYYLNRGLFVGARFNYGLSDITREAGDISRQEVESTEQYVFRDKHDRNLNLQLSVGFNF